MDAKLTGELIARRRRELGLSQTELAERLQNCPEILSVDAAGTAKVRITLKKGNIPAEFVAKLIHEKVPVTGFEIAEKHLEELFLNATKGEVQ